ncbi:hypothetical protein GOODEAATRI_022262 [Goodea atripinnis]|uniref:Uncharacterized protein n=1 Tax=Goodea atripinnis TaxID=208336 RepID=A0ABV0N3J6_9TELE
MSEPASTAALTFPFYKRFKCSHLKWQKLQLRSWVYNTWFWMSHESLRAQSPYFTSLTVLLSVPRRSVCFGKNSCMQTVPGWIERRVKPGLWLNSGSRSHSKAQAAFDHPSTSQFTYTHVVN